MSDNKYKHKNSHSLYAHFSEIDDYDCDLFPELKSTSPIHVRLKKGQSVYIPKKWWHWIRTTEKTFAINFWFQNKDEQSPFTFNHDVQLDITSLDDETVFVWNSAKHYGGDRAYETTFKDFYNSGIDDRFIITLGNYPTGAKNSHIKKKISDSIKFPSDRRIVSDGSYDFNVWVSSNKHDTGLHYDDEDGILLVLEGEKDITLFPPSDSKYLRPYDTKHDWSDAPATLFRYNTFRNIMETKGVSSAELLYITCCDDIRVLSNISKLYYRYPRTNLIWGFKKDGDNYRWEVYLYTLREKIKIKSWDINKNEYDIGEEEHYYFMCEDTSFGLPFWGYGKYKKQDVLYDESKIFVVDSYKSFCSNYEEYMDRLGYDHIKFLFRDIILKKYNCYEICIHNKKPNQIFVQYLGISNENFLQFLLTESYPSNIIDFVMSNIKDNNYHINNEITIVYDINTLQVVRSGFYGNL